MPEQEDGYKSRNALRPTFWPSDRTGIARIDYTAKRDGLLAARHFPGLVKTGDCLAVVAVVVA